MQGPTSTSFALLGLLAARSRSAYEMTQDMRRSVLRLLWPRAESQLYAEPKKLVALGLATARTERKGARKRTVCAITPDGRRALAEWLSVPGKGPSIEFEAMLKILYADGGDRSQLAANLSAMREELNRSLEIIAGVLTDLRDGAEPVTGRLHLVTLVNLFNVSVFRSLAEWIDRAEAESAEWASTELDGEREEEARRTIGVLLEEIESIRHTARVAAAAEPLPGRES